MSYNNSSLSVISTQRCGGRLQTGRTTRASIWRQKYAGHVDGRRRPAQLKQGEGNGEWPKMKAESRACKALKITAWNFYCISEKAMAPHSSALAWKIPWTEEPGRLQSMGSRRARHNWATFTFHFHALEKAMATHSSVLAWRTPGTGEPGGLLSMGSHRVGHDWSDLAAGILKRDNLT